MQAAAACRSIISRMNSFVHHRPLMRSMAKATKYSAEMKGLYSPKMTTPEIEKIGSVLGVNIGLTSIAWARVEVPENRLTHVDYHMFPADSIKMNPNDTYFFVLKLLESLPKADRVVMESINKQIHTTGGHLHLLLQATRFQIISTMVSVLNDRSKNKDSQIQPVIFLRYQLAGKLFNLLVGNELVACKDTVMELLTDEFEGPPNPNTLPYTVKISNDVLDKFKKDPDVGKELMGRAFLVTLAFTELIINTNPASFKLLQGRLRYEA